MLALNVYRWGRGRNPADRFEQLASRLQLNADQKTKVQQIFGDTRQQLQTLRKESEPRVDEIRQQTDQRLQQVLTPEQWQDFQQMRDEMRARRGRAGARKSAITTSTSLSEKTSHYCECFRELIKLP